MDWLALQATMLRDERMPARAFRLNALEAVLDGRQYDGLKHPFSEERGDNEEYVPLTKRRPSVRTNLCRVVVDDAASMLFSEGHWPAIKAKDPATSVVLTALVKQARLNDTMLDAATRGSVGSVAILLRVLKNKPFFEVMAAANLTPFWQVDDPDVLAKVVERYTVKGADLAALGYAVTTDQVQERFWFQREWDDAAETWFLPVPVSATGDAAVPRVDVGRTVEHGLGFVPMLWIRNLPSKDRVDGACTFEAAIDTVIEGDYLLSQGGRALKYASDPTLVIHDPTLNGAAARVGGAATSLVLPPESDAKLLEINGQSAKAVLEHVQQIRAIALEAIHGNRSNADKLSAATSGRSIELMMTGLIWLADKLRISYGEGALLGLLRMVCSASAALDGGLLIDGRPAKDIDPAGLELRWAPWMPPMPDDTLKVGQALVTALDGRIVSQETAAGRFGALLGVDDAAAELLRIKADMADAQSQALASAQATADLQAASAARTAAKIGQTTTRQATA